MEPAPEQRTALVQSRGGVAVQPQLFYVGVKAVIVRDGKALLLKAADGRGGYFWDLPGGRMAPGEQIEQALRRELREELPSATNVHVRSLIHAAPVGRQFDGGAGLLLLYYRVHADVPGVELSEEHVGHTWVGAEHLAALGRADDGVATIEGIVAVLGACLGTP